MVSESDRVRLAKIKQRSAAEARAKARADEKTKKETERKNSLKKFLIIFPFFLYGTYSIAKNVIFNDLDYSPVKEQDFKSASSRSIYEEFTGGSLHTSTIYEWSRASASNKFATAGDWMVSVLGEDQARDVTRLKNRTNVVVHCIDELSPTISESYDPREAKVNSVALLCIKRLEANGWR